MNKKTKMFFGNQHITSFVCDGNRITPFGQFKKIIKMGIFLAFVSTLIGGLGYGVFKSGEFSTEAKVIYAEKQVIKEVEVINAPVLERIAKCESGNMHYKNGQVVMRANTNNTVDIGRYQINTVWNAQATKLSLDLTKEADNKKMAEWIYTNIGTGPWSASSHCWNK